MEWETIHYEYVVSLRDEGKTYKEIVPMLEEKFGIEITPGALKTKTYRYKNGLTASKPRMKKGSGENATHIDIDSHEMIIEIPKKVTTTVLKMINQIANLLSNNKSVAYIAECLDISEKTVRSYINKYNIKEMMLTDITKEQIDQMKKDYIARFKDHVFKCWGCNEEKAIYDYTLWYNKRDREINRACKKCHAKK